MFSAWLQETRELLVSPFSSTEPLLDSLTAACPLEVRKSWGVVSVCKNTYFQSWNGCGFNTSCYNVWCLGGIRTFWTSSDYSAWARKTAPLTSACASPTSFGVEISTTDSIWTYRLAQQVKVNNTKWNDISKNSDALQDILKHVSKRAFDELMCADQLTRERHKRKAFLNFSEFQFTAGISLNKAIKITGQKPFMSLSHSVLSLFIPVKTKRRSLSHPPTGTSGGLGTAICGRNTRLLEWVIYFSFVFQMQDIWVAAQ